MSAAVNALAGSQALVLRAIEAAAEVSAPCPSNAELGDLVAGGASVACSAIRALEKKGFIIVQRYARDRQMTIVATGKSTRYDGSKAPHWRYARKASA